MAHRPHLGKLARVAQLSEHTKSAIGQREWGVLNLEIGAVALVAMIQKRTKRNLVIRFVPFPPCPSLSVIFMSQNGCLGNFSLAQNCSEFHTTWSYLRPGGGMSIVPWLLIVAILLVHVPVVVVRIVRWESGQVWSLALAAFAISLTCLAFRSTQFDPEQIYV